MFNTITSKTQDIMDIKNYRLNSLEEPTDEMLHELMGQVAKSARESYQNAQRVLKERMEDTIKLIHQQRDVPINRFKIK